MKAQQSSKIREIGEALVAAGFRALDEQAEVLGLPRSTTWTILNRNYKNSGLSAATINRILATPQLPPIVRAKIHEYIEEKIAGLYGDSKTQLRRFFATLNPSTSTEHRHVPVKSGDAHSLGQPPVIHKSKARTKDIAD